jgi:hypothetical protein
MLSSPLLLAQMEGLLNMSNFSSHRNFLTEVDLAGNHRLAGSTLAIDVGNEAARFPQLRTLNVQGCALEGAVPKWLEEHITSPPGGGFSLFASGNAFEWPDDGASRTGLTTLIESCRLDVRVSCEGLPPRGCEAFGPDFRINAADPEQCTRCSANDRVASIVALAVAFACAVTGIGVYVLLIRRHQDSMRAWVSTVSIFIAHLQVRLTHVRPNTPRARCLTASLAMTMRSPRVQTIAIVGSMRLRWPPPVERMTEIVSFSVVDASFLQPECIADEKVNAFAMLALGQVSGRRPSALHERLGMRGIGVTRGTRRGTGSRSACRARHVSCHVSRSSLVCLGLRGR